MKLIAVLLFVCAFLCAGSGAWGQNAPAPAPQKAATGLEPIFPAVNPNLEFVEAEDALSTNFAREPVLNYGVSGFRALQLNRATGLEGVGSFYADYVFTLPSSGTWELWYGGTPPGPRDELYTSYASPFTITIDSGEKQPVTRESVWVVENYTPSYYWNRVGDLSLDASRHKIRFEVTEKRRTDGRYVFYMDCFFLVKKEGGQRILAEPSPAVFPKNMEDKSIDVPFPSIDDMLIRLRDDPTAVEPLIQISQLYSMMGDYLNALKYLNRAAVLKPHDPQIGVLIAKNRIWKGDLPEGLKAYRDVLGLDPKQRGLWLEAGKVAAWNGSYPDSISFYRDALAVFPGDLDATVNLGLTYLWAGKGQDAETAFRSAQALAGNDPVKLKNLARVYQVNGYPDRAVQTLEAAVGAAPRDLEARLLLMQAMLSMGKKTEAESVRKAIGDSYVPSPELASALDSFQEKQGLKNQILAEDEARLAQNPDNLVLRQTLAQSYFWNGSKSKAVSEYRQIIANYTYSAISDMESRSPLPHLLDQGYAMDDYFFRLTALVRQAQNALSAQMAKHAQAGSARDAAQQALAAAQQAQSRAKEGKEADAALEVVHKAEEKLQAAEDALQKAGDDLSSRTQAAAGLANQYEQVTASAAADAGSLKDLAEKDAAAESAFAQATKLNGWKFDRAGTLAELAQDARDDDLSRVVAAKIFLTDRLTERAQLLLARDAGSHAASSAAWTLAQSYLWGGKAKQASAVIARLGDDPGNARMPEYFADFATLIKSLSGAPDLSPAQLSDTDPLSAAKTAAAQLAPLEKQAVEQRAALDKNLRQLQLLYRHAVTRAVYASEQRVSSIRNELGDYYLAADPPALDQAIVQFTRVLAVDPADLEATFRLGKVYEWNRDWSSALSSYRAVYKADPNFENVATLYNHLARVHAEEVSTLTSGFADTQQTQWHAEAGWTRSFDSTLGISAAYSSDDMRIEKTMYGVPDHSSYQVHAVSLGMPIELSSLDLRLTPWLGGILSGNGLFTNTGGTASNDLFEVYSGQPYVKLDTSIGAWNVLFANATLRWGPQVETLDPARGMVLYDASMEANLSTNLSTVDKPVLRDTSLRTYAKVDLVHTAALGYQNFMYTALQELTVNVLKGGSPYSVLALTGSVTYQSSLYYEPYLYYAPDSIFVAGGSITGSTWLGIGGSGDVLGLSLRAFGGDYLELAFQPGTIHRFKGEAEADATLTHGNGTWKLTLLGNTTWNFDTQSWDYWSLFLRLGYTLKLPDLLAP